MYFNLEDFSSMCAFNWPCWEDPWDLPESSQSFSSVLSAHLLHASPAAWGHRYTHYKVPHLSASVCASSTGYICHPRPQCSQYSLYDHLQGLSQRNRFVVEEVEVQLVAEVRCGLEQSVELLLHHLIFFFWHLDSYNSHTRVSGFTLKRVRIFYIVAKYYS